MILKQLALNQFRNYEHVEMMTNHHVNIIIGPNAQGKTNLLEAIFTLALSKSHRTNKDRELIQWHADYAKLHGTIEKKYGESKLELHISQQGKKAKINGLEQSKLSDFIGNLIVVMFAPEDLDIVKGAPGVRRRFLDIEIGQVQPRYVYDLMQYQKVLLQRNNYLRKYAGTPSFNHDMMDVWNEQLIDYGSKIIVRRHAFIMKLQQWAEQVHASITNNQEQLLITYNPSFEIEDFHDETVVANQFMIKLSQVKESEMKRGLTLLGPHRDDLKFAINDKEVQVYGSQGQQRTTALSLKLAEIQLIHDEIGEYPILLLDDVLSELDSFRQTQLIETFQEKVQTFITTTSIDSVNMAKLDHAHLIHVQEGILSYDTI